MREIKFRAWDTKHKKYIGIVDLSISRIFWDYPLGDNDDYYLEQYIGIKDKNGIEIYEGDLVESLASIYPTDDTILSDGYRITTGIQKGRKVFRVDYQKNFHGFEFIGHGGYYIDSNISNREYVVVGNLRENSII